MKHKELVKYTILLPGEYFHPIYAEVRINITVRLNSESKMYLILELIMNGRERWSYNNEHLAISVSFTDEIS